MSSHLKMLLAVLVTVTLGIGIAACDSKDDEESQEQEEETFVERDFQELTEEQIESLPFHATGPVATVDGEEVSPDRFNELVFEQMERMPFAIQPQMVDRFREQAVEAAINQHMIERHLFRQDIEVTEEDIDELMEQFLAGLGGDEDMFKMQLEMMGMTEEDFREQMEEHAQLEKFLEAEYGLEITDEEVEELFEEFKEHFGEPDKVHARHILIQVDEDADDAAESEARTRAESIAEQAQAEDADFEALAREYSEGPSAGEGGDLGFFAHGDMVPAFSNQAFSMEPGEVSEPVRSRFGFHVIQVVDTQEGSEPDIEEARPQLEFRLKEQKFGEAFQNFVEELREDVEIEEHPDNIEVTLDASSAPPAHGMPPMPGGAQQGGEAPQLQLEPADGDSETEGTQELQLQLGD